MPLRCNGVEVKVLKNGIAPVEVKKSTLSAVLSYLPPVKITKFPVTIQKTLSERFSYYGPVDSKTVAKIILKVLIGIEARPTLIFYSSKSRLERQPG